MGNVTSQYDTMILTIKSIKWQKHHHVSSAGKAIAEPNLPTDSRYKTQIPLPGIKLGRLRSRASLAGLTFSLSRSQLRRINGGETLKQQFCTDPSQNISPSQKLETKINFFSDKQAGSAARAMTEEEGLFEWGCLYQEQKAAAVST